jgi:hypothetical protein
MSFILDALKKSEEERLRQQNPSTLPTAVRRTNDRTPSWVWALLGLLAVNLVVLAFVLLKPATPPPAAEPESPLIVATTSVPSDTSSIVQPVTPPGQVASSTPTTVMPRIDATPIPTAPPLSSVPSRDQQIAAGANLPAATLNLHVYDSDPAKRFVLLNGERLREADTSRDNLKVLSITPEGVVLGYGDSSFAVSIEDR